MRFRIFFCSALCVISMIHTTGNAQSNPILDIKWKVVEKNDSTILMQMGIRTNKAGVKIRDANFVFDYDDFNIAFAPKGGYGENFVDYFWHDGFSPADTAYSTVTKLVKNRISVNIHAESSLGSPVSSDTSYTPVIDFKFKVLKPNAIAKISMIMVKTYPPIFDNVFDSTFTAFVEGEGWDKPVLMQLR